MNKKTAKLLPIAASLVLAVGLAGGIAGVIAGTKDAAAPVTAIGNTEFTINDTNTTIVEEDGKKILRFVSTGQAAGAVIDFAIDGTYERAGRNVMITLKAGASITSTHIRELTQLAVNSNNAAGLKLETSRDGAKFVEVDGFNGENKTFEYPPHYFKLTATEDVTIMHMTVFDNCTDVTPSASDFKGTWKGTITGHDYPNDVGIESYEITVTVEDDKVTGFLYFDVDAQEWNPIDLYVIDMGNPEVYLAEDPNDPQPDMVFTLAWEQGGGITISSDDYETVYLNFTGSEFNPSENITIKDQGSTFDGNEITELVINAGTKSDNIYGVLDFGSTDNIVWTIADPEIATIGNGHDETVTTMAGGNAQSVFINGESAGTTKLTASTGYVTAEVAITVEAVNGEIVDEIPDYLNYEHYDWTDGNVDVRFMIASIYICDYAEYYGDEVNLDTENSTKSGSIYSLVFDGGIVIEYDESYGTVKFADNSMYNPGVTLNEGNTWGAW